MILSIEVLLLKVCLQKHGLGILHPEMEENVQLLDNGAPSIYFRRWISGGIALLRGLDRCSRREVLLATASPAEAADGTSPEVQARLLRLESALEGIQTGLSTLLSQNQGATAKVKVQPIVKKVSRAPEKASPSSAAGFPGLDISVVQAALRSGVSPEHFAEMSKLVQRKNPKAEIAGKGRGLTKAVNLLGESEEEDVEAEAPEQVEAAPSEASDPMANALLKLTTIVEALAGKKKPKELEDILDESAALETGPGLVTSGNQRRQAAESSAEAPGGTAFRDLQPCGKFDAQRLWISRIHPWRAEQKRLIQRMARTQKSCSQHPSHRSVYHGQWPALWTR